LKDFLILPTSIELAVAPAAAAAAAACAAKTADVQTIPLSNIATDARPVGDGFWARAPIVHQQMFMQPIPPDDDDYCMDDDDEDVQERITNKMFRGFENYHLC
jgi:hypothetical protein